MSVKQHKEEITRECLKINSKELLEKLDKSYKQLANLLQEDDMRLIVPVWKHGDHLLFKLAQAKTALEVFHEEL